MIPQSQVRKPRNSSRVNLLISLGFHGLIVVGLLYFAAREGLLGKQIKKIAVEMVKEKKPEQKPKEPEKPKEPPPDQPKVAIRTEAPKEVVQAPPPSTVVAPPAIAPAAMDVPSFAFDGGKAVETASSPIEVYRGLMQSSFQARWNRPDDMDDDKFVAEIEVGVDREGQISHPIWKKFSGNKRWDDSVKDAVAITKNMNHAPPTNFPPRVIVRFDVVQSEPILP